jgi:hypothetical protein
MAITGSGIGIEFKIQLLQNKDSFYTSTERLFVLLQFVFHDAA